MPVDSALRCLLATCVLAGLSAAAAPPACPEADLDGNGLVDEADLEIVRSQLGRVCEPRIGSVSPTLGAASRKTTILIEGSALGDATSVTIGGESADVDARGVTSVSFFALGDAAPDTVLDAVAAAIELAGLGDETELLLHPASGTLIARTTEDGDDLIGRAIYSILHEQRTLQLQGGAVPKAEYERMVEETRALGAQLRSRSTEIQRLNAAMERLTIDLFDRERRIATLLAQLDANGIAPQAAPQPEP